MFIYLPISETLPDACFSVLITGVLLKGQASLKKKKIQVTQGLRSEGSLITAHPLAAKCSCC